MSTTRFPLRWESTGDQWWFASPIDYAAANGHYDLVRELLHIDTNLLIKLTSLPRIRRLETVWDDEDPTAGNVATCRAHVARNLLRECQSSKGHNSLIRAGYGGWLLYTAASAGDLPFVKELLHLDPLLVFGEGEYGVTDIFYAAARSKSCEVFRLVFEGAVEAKGRRKAASGEVFRREMANRAVHAAARGGSLAVLMELLEGLDVLGYRDVQGSTVLHSAAGRGQIEVVKTLISSHDIINSVDNRGNTALHVAAYLGHLSVVETLISASPSSASLTNNYGDTFLHMAVAGFRTPTFRRLDRQIELIKRLVSGEFVNIGEIINVQNKDGKTALHIAVVENVQYDVVELLMSVQYVDLNIRDSDGYTPLDILKQRPRSASSEILIKRLISAGGIDKISNSQITRNTLASHLRIHGIGGNPGTLFTIPDGEIFLYTGVEESGELTEYGCSGEIEQIGSTKYKKSSPMNRAARNFKILLSWPRKKEKIPEASNLEENFDCSPDSYGRRSSFKNSPIPLRHQFSRRSSLPNNKRIMSLQGGINNNNNNFPSPSAKKKYAAGLSHGVLNVLPRSSVGSPSSAFSESTCATPIGSSGKNQSPNVEKSKMKMKNGSFNMGLMNNYFCLGGHSLAVEKSTNPPLEIRDE